MKKKILNHTSIMIVLAVLITFLAASVVTYSKFNTYMQNGVREEAWYICLGMEEYGDTFLSKRLRAVSSSRVTLIQKDGTVLFDSQTSPEKLENHSNRPEFMEAEKDGKSESIRYSETFAKKTFYYAVRLDNGNVLRVGKTVDSVYSTWISSLAVLGILMVLVLILEFAFVERQTRELIKPINDLDLEHPLNNVCYEELRPLLVRVDEQNRQIRQQVKELKEAEEIRKEFSANVSHELKTPLMSISGYAELIENHMVDPEQETRFALEIQQNATRLLSLINDIIRLSELDSGEDNLLCFEQVDLDEVAGTCVKNLQMNAQKRNVTLYYEGVSCMLRADRGMISELVENLCQNAIRYNNEGGEVHVRVYYEKGQPMLSVADNGIGIPKDQQERIFERFYRVDKSRSKQTGGTGLGLAIVKHIVELHDAVLHLESEPGKGTTITVAF